MPLDDAYATAAEYRARVIKADSSDDAAILADLKAAKALIDHRAGQPFGFNKDASATTRVIWPKAAGRSLIVPPIADPTGMAILVDTSLTGSFSGYTAIPDADFQLRPLDAALTSLPYTEIYIPSWASASTYLWAVDVPVQITAIFGWPAVPEAIKRACIELTAIVRLESPRGTNRLDDFGQVLSISARARDIIDDLIRVYHPTGGVVVG
jgi:hypothetical protein